MIVLSGDQRQELEQTARTGLPAYIRVKALAILNLADGRPKTEIAAFLHKSRVTIREWERRYLEQGVAGFLVRPGRGRKSRVDLTQVETYVRQSPRAFGLAQTRWTLQAVGHVVPTLKGYSAPGVHRVLARAKLSYKRGQPWLHSPDPRYLEKKSH